MAVPSFVFKSLVENERRPDESPVSTSPEGVFMAGVSSSPVHSAELSCTKDNLVKKSG